MKFNNEILRKSGFLDDYYCPSEKSLKRCRDNLAKEIKALEELLIFIRESKDDKLKANVIEIAEISYSINNVENVFKYILSKIKILKNYFLIVNNIINNGDSYTYQSLNILYTIMNEFIDKEDKDAR